MLIHRELTDNSGELSTFSTEFSTVLNTGGENSLRTDGKRPPRTAHRQRAGFRRFSTAEPFFHHVGGDCGKARSKPPHGLARTVRRLPGLHREAGADQVRVAKKPRTSRLPCARGGGFASAKPEGLFCAAKRGRASTFAPAVNPSVSLSADSSPYTGEPEESAIFAPPMIRDN